jgi:hypothetical protein
MLPLPVPEMGCVDKMGHVYAIPISAVATAMFVPPINMGLTAHNV